MNYGRFAALWALGFQTITSYPGNEWKRAFLLFGPVLGTPAQAAAKVFAKYPAGTVHVYLASQAYTDAGGTVHATAGQAIARVTDTAGTSNALQASGSNKPTAGSGGGKVNVGFDFAATQFMSTGPLWSAGDDCLVVFGGAPTSVPGGGQFAVSLAVNSGAFTSYGAIAFVASGFHGEWAGSPGVDASFANVTTPHVCTVRKVGTTPVARVNGSQVATGSLVGVSANATDTGVIGRLCTIDGNGYTGSMYALVAIKGTVTDADTLTIERWVNTLTPTGTVF